MDRRQLLKATLAGIGSLAFAAPAKARILWAQTIAIMARLLSPAEGA
jgi:hypothetical protein